MSCVIVLAGERRCFFTVYFSIGAERKRNIVSAAWDKLKKSIGSRISFRVSCKHEIFSEAWTEIPLVF